MGNILKKAKGRITPAEALGLNPDDPEDQAFLAFKDFIVGLEVFMIQHHISKNELARKMKISRQAVYDKFRGRNLTRDWITRACNAVGVTLQIRFVPTKSHPEHDNSLIL